MWTKLLKITRTIPYLYYLAHYAILPADTVLIGDQTKISTLIHSFFFKTRRSFFFCLKKEYMSIAQWAWYGWDNLLSPRTWHVSQSSSSEASRFLDWSGTGKIVQPLSVLVVRRGQINNLYFANNNMYRFCNLLLFCCCENRHIIT